MERSLGWPGVSINKNLWRGSSGEEAALSSTETGCWEVCVKLGEALSIGDSEESGEEEALLRPARFSKSVRRAVLPAPEGPARRIDGSEDEEDEEPDSSPCRYWWRITGKRRTIRRPVIMTVLLGWREATRKSLRSSLMYSVEELDIITVAVEVATTVAVVAMVSIVVDIVAVELEGSLRGVRSITCAACVRSECVEEGDGCYSSIPFSIC